MTATRTVRRIIPRRIDAGRQLCVPFELTPWVIAVYVAIVIAVALLAWRAWSWRAVGGVAIGAGLYYFGTKGTPWPVFILVVTLFAYQVGSWRLALSLSSASASSW